MPLVKRTRQKRIRISEAAEMLGYKCNQSVLTLGLTLYPLNPNSKRKTYTVALAEVERIIEAQFNAGRSTSLVRR